jgi:hypothetical protein
MTKHGRNLNITRKTAVALKIPTIGIGLTVCSIFFKLEINKTSASVIFNKFDKSRSVFVCPYLRYHLKELEEEIGGKELVEEFKLKKLEFSHQSLILNDESSWVDIAIEAVKSRIQPTNGTENELLSQEEAENYFLSMIEYFNNIRETERDKRCAEFNKAWETTSDPKALKEAEETIKDYSSPYKSSSNGCMLILPFLISASFAFFYLVLFMV